MQLKLAKNDNEQSEASVYRNVAELASQVGLSQSSTYAALRRGDIPHIRIGKRLILPRHAIEVWLRSAGGILRVE